MCRTVHALLQTVICGLQMLVRVFMTIILMIENLIRMILQTLYNLVSFILQCVSLIPICLVFFLTSKLKCFMCGGGGPCPINRGGGCDCVMSLIAIIILFLIFRATGVLDKLFFKLGYVQHHPRPLRLNASRFVPTPGDITECSREEFETECTSDCTEFTGNFSGRRFITDGMDIEDLNYQTEMQLITLDTQKTLQNPTEIATESLSNWTTILYYMV